MSTFSTLACYHKELTDGADPSTIGTGNYFVQEGILFKNTAPDDEEGGDESIMVVPTSLPEAENIIHALHNNLGHLGITIVTAALHQRVWMLYLAELVKCTLRTCNPCQFSRCEPSIPQTLHPLPHVNLGDIWAFDFVGPLTKVKNRNQYILNSMDLGTDFTYGEALPRCSGEFMVSLLCLLISLLGVPLAILTDNGEEFMSYIVQNFLQRMKIRHLHTSLYHPQTNGRLEKFNDTCVQMLARYTAPNRQDEWDKYLPDTFLAHNTHINRSIKYSLIYMLCSCEPLLPHDTVYNIVCLPPTDNEIEALQKHRLEYVHDLEKFRKDANTEGHELLERIAKEREQGYLEWGLTIGDLVKRQNKCQSKLHPCWDGPFIICDISDKNTYQLMTRNSHILQNLYNGE